MTVLPNIDELVGKFEAPSLSNLGPVDQEKLRVALKDGWRLTPATMASKITKGRWIAARHLLYISTIVATAVARGNARIILCMPFRHGKSEFLSVHTPIWFLERWPNKYVMSITYGLELATDFSLKVRETFQDEDLHHLLRTRISKKKQRVDRFLTTGGGGLTAAGIGGPIVGRGGDLVLIDDYIKNAEEAMSIPAHKKTFEWFRSTAYTRLEPNASIVVLATRWGQKDLIGQLITRLPHENWTVINLPMHAMVNDPLGRAEGEVLWPERYDAPACERIRLTLGNFWYQAQCQQDPLASMSGAELGEKLKIIEESDLPPEEELKTIRVWDLAATEGGGDYTTGIKMSRHAKTKKIFIHDLRRKQLSPGKNKTLVMDTADSDGHGVKIWMEQEPGSSGKTVIKDYDDLLAGYSFEGEKATGPIEVRASPFIANVERGNTYMVRSDWNEDLKDELDAFPDGENDDQVVGAALGYNKLVHGVSGALTWGRDPHDSKIIRLQRRHVKRAPEVRTARRRKLTW